MGARRSVRVSQVPTHQTGKTRCLQGPGFAHGGGTVDVQTGNGRPQSWQRTLVTESVSYSNCDRFLPWGSVTQRHIQKSAVPQLTGISETENLLIIGIQYENRPRQSSDSPAFKSVFDLCRIGRGL